MIRLLLPNIEELKLLHYEAVKSYVADIMLCLDLKNMIVGMIWSMILSTGSNNLY